MLGCNQLKHMGKYYGSVQMKRGCSENYKVFIIMLLNSETGRHIFLSQNFTNDRQAR